jgi:hypothetical protein
MQTYNTALEVLEELNSVNIYLTDDDADGVRGLESGDEYRSYHFSVRRFGDLYHLFYEVPAPIPVAALGAASVA